MDRYTRRNYAALAAAEWADGAFGAVDQRIAVALCRRGLLYEQPARCWHLTSAGSKALAVLDQEQARREEAAAAGLREVPVPARGSGPVECCGGHRARCLFGGMHSWGTWYEDGRLQRTDRTFYCWTCGGVCTAEESEEANDG